MNKCCCPIIVTLSPYSNFYEGNDTSSIVQGTYTFNRFKKCGLDCKNASTYILL